MSVHVVDAEGAMHCATTATFNVQSRPCAIAGGEPYLHAFSRYSEFSGCRKLDRGQRPAGRRNPRTVRFCVQWPCLATCACSPRPCPSREVLLWARFRVCELPQTLATAAATMVAHLASTLPGTLPGAIVKPRIFLPQSRPCSKKVLRPNRLEQRHSTHPRRIPQIVPLATYILCMFSCSTDFGRRSP